MMIRKCDKPDVFKAIEEDFLYIECFNKEGVFAHYAIDLRMPKCAVLHMEVERFTTGIFKEMLCDWDVVKETLRGNGVRKVAVTQLGGLKDHSKWARFICHFGFDTIVEQITSTQEI